MKAHTYQFDGDFKLESGEILHAPEIQFHTSGTLYPDGKHVVWICHALTAHSNPEEWWSGLVGENKIFDPEQYFVICVNMLGSPYGSTSPLSIDEKTGKQYLHTFPRCSIRDNVRIFSEVCKFLGITSIWCILGGSTGGQCALQWLITESHLFCHAVLLATNAVHSSWGIAWNAAQRMALEADETFWQYDENGGKKGLSAARAIAMISYRNYYAFERTQLRPTYQEPIFRAESYLRYQGEKLVQRFSAHSYYTLTHTMDSHNVGGAEYLGKITAKTLVIGISSDILFPINEQEFIAKNIQQSVFQVIDSPFGHDGFLIEFLKLEIILKEFLLIEN